MKKILATLLISTAVFSSVTPIIPTFAIEINQTSESQINPLVLKFLTKVQKTLILDKNYHAINLTEEATDSQVQELYAEATRLIVNSSNSFSKKDQQIVYQLSHELLKAMKNELKKPSNQSYEIEKINFYNQQINELFIDVSRQSLKETVNEDKLIELFKSFIKYENERRDRDQATIDNITNLFERLNHAILIWTNELENKIDKLFIDSNHLENGISREDINILANNVENLNKFDLNLNCINKLKLKIQKAQDLFNHSQKEDNTTQTFNLGGQGIGGYSDHSHDSGFSRVSLEVKDHKASLVKHSDYQFHWGGWKTSKYASIKLTDPNGNVLYDQAWKGNETVKGNGYQKFGTFAQYDLSEGSTVEIYHAEGPWHRFSTNDNDTLKTKLEKIGYIYTYKMQNNQLVLTNVDENVNGKHEDDK